MRIFIAIDLNLEIKRQLESLVRRLKPAAAGLKWVAPENYHLTLKFIGEADEKAVATIKSVLTEVVAKHRQFSLKLKGTGSFPPGRSRMRVIWVGVQADHEFQALHQNLETSLAQKGFAPEDRPFSPHLTLARAREPQRQEKLKAELEKLSQEEFGEMTVKEITLFQSILRPEGPEYRVIGKYYLP